MQKNKVTLMKSKKYKKCNIELVDKLENKIEIKVAELIIDSKYNRAKVKDLTKRVIEKEELEK